MDDGSRDVEESLALLQMQSEQGVELVIATPHFYANDETVEQFLERRQETFEALQAQLPPGSPQILLGAEVRYYQGISRFSDLKKLCIQGSRVLLLEMPMCRWTEYMLRDLKELASMGSIRIILAHIERYLSLQRGDIWSDLLDRGVLMQVNAGFFAPLGTRRKAISMLRKGSIHVVGSDCHNIASRPPKIDRAFYYIQKKLGEDYLRQMDEFGHDLLGLTGVSR
jgi:protein-tyrosine phosphatase